MRLQNRYVLHVLVVVFLSVLLGPLTPARADEQDGYVPREVVVKLHRAADLPGLAANYGLRATPLDQFGTRPIYRLRILDGVDPQIKAELLEGDGRVQYAEPNFIAQAPESRLRSGWAKTDSAGYGAQWAPDMIRLSEAHAVTQGAGTIVAVLDTGVDRRHPALKGRLLRGYDFVNMDRNPSEVGNPSRNPAYGHGTHVAGLIALTSPGAKILPIRVLNPNGEGNIWVLAEAIAYAADPDSNPATNDGAHVINMSLGTTRRTELLAEVLVAATCSNGNDDDDDDDDIGCLAPLRKGMVVVSAAGNSGGSVREYPAAEQVDGALAVAASTAADQLAVFSTSGDWVPIAAPGENITSAIPGKRYATWSGTSMAAPFVAGTAAMIRALEPGLSAAEIADRLLDTADPFPGPVPLRLDAAAAVDAP